MAREAVNKRTLVASTTSGGTVSTPPIGTSEHSHGATVKVTATAGPNSHFLNWTGSAVFAGKVTNPNAATTDVTIDGDYTLRANFFTRMQPGQFNECQFISKTNRTLHEDRKKHEWKVLYLTLLFYITSTLAVLSGKITLGDSNKYAWLLCIPFFMLAGCSTYDFRKTAKANRLNLDMAQKAEDQVLGSLGIEAPKEKSQKDPHPSKHTKYTWLWECLPLPYDIPQKGCHPREYTWLWECLLVWLGAVVASALVWFAPTTNHGQSLWLSLFSLQVR